MYFITIKKCFTIMTRKCFHCGIHRKCPANNKLYACYVIKFPEWRPIMVPLCHEFLSGEKKACGDMKSSQFLQKEKSGMFESLWLVFQLFFFFLFFHLAKSELFSVGVKTTQTVSCILTLQTFYLI